MNKFKFDAYLQEFPFLREILGDRSHLDCEFIRVARADENLLLRRPKRNVAVGSMVDIDDRDEVIFITPTEIVRNAVTVDYEYYSNYAHDENYREPGETVLEALAGLENPDEVQYIVWLSSGYDIVDHCSRDTYCVTVYKPIKGVNYSDLIEKARAQALAEVKAEANF